MEKLKLVETCSACPEQYDVYLGDELVGYMRLRHGYFHAECRDERVYEAEVRGDGRFYSEAERHQHLNEACRAVREALDGEGEEPLYEIARGEG